MKRLSSLLTLIIFCFSTLCGYPTFALTAPAELSLPPGRQTLAALGPFGLHRIAGDADQPQAAAEI